MRSNRQKYPFADMMPGDKLIIEGPKDVLKKMQKAAHAVGARNYGQFKTKMGETSLYVKCLN